MEFLFAGKLAGYRTDEVANPFEVVANVDELIFPVVLTEPPADDNRVKYPANLLVDDSSHKSFRKLIFENDTAIVLFSDFVELFRDYNSEHPA